MKGTRGAAAVSGVGSLPGLGTPPLAPFPAEMPSVIAVEDELVLTLFLRAKLVQDWLRDALVRGGGDGGSLTRPLASFEECVRRTPPVTKGVFWVKRKFQFSHLRVVCGTGGGVTSTMFRVGEET